MRLAALLVQLAASTSCVLAFYPFKPAWLEEKNQARGLHDARRAVGGGQGVSLEIEQTWPADRALVSPAQRAAREAARLAGKYGGHDLSKALPATNGALRKRLNKYHIMQSADSGKPLTTGIDQDGTDYAYFVQVQLGSKGKQLYMLLDTGAASSWVMGSSCAQKACSMHNTFGPGDSDTFQAISKDFSVSYGSGTVHGQLAADTIALAGISFKYKFGLASTTSDEFTNFAFDGILGLSMSQGTNENFLNKIAETHKLDQNIFCVALNRASEGLNTGEIKFGSTNPDKYTGNITYAPVGSSNGDWAVNIDDMAFDGKKAQVGGVLGYIDTGTSFIFGSEDMVAKVHSVIPGATTSNGQRYTVPCDTNKPLTFTFAGTDYEVSPKDWISPKDSAGKCSSNIYGFEVAKGSWLLGDTFLKNVYTIFDKDQNRIGFASMAGSNSAQSGSGPWSSTNAPPQATGTPVSGMAATLPTAVGPHPEDHSQQSQETTGPQTTPSAGADEAKEKSKSGAAGVTSQNKANFAAAIFIAALLALVA